MPTPRAITKQELEAIKLSVEIARLVALDDRIGAFRVYLRAARGVPTTKRKIAQDVLLAELRWFETRSKIVWNDPIVKGVIVDALDQNDSKFMMKLARALCRPAKRLSAADTKAEKLKQFLLDHWAESQDGLPAFFYFNPEDTADLCSDRLGFEVGYYNVKQLCHRLRLKSFPHKHYKLKRSRDGTRILGIDKI